VNASAPYRHNLGSPNPRTTKAVAYRPQSSSASRFTADASGFFILSQSGERPERYIESLRFDTIPSSPILQAWAKTVGPAPSQVFIEPDASASFGQHGCERGLADFCAPVAALEPVWRLPRPTDERTQKPAWSSSDDTSPVTDFRSARCAPIHPRVDQTARPDVPIRAGLLSSSACRVCIGALGSTITSRCNAASCTTTATSVCRSAHRFTRTSSRGGGHEHDHP
jgi:hypothetical protein